MTLFPKIDVLTRQNFNIKKRIMRNRFRGTKVGEDSENCPGLEIISSIVRGVCIVNEWRMAKLNS